MGKFMSVNEPLPTPQRDFARDKTSETILTSTLTTCCQTLSEATNAQGGGIMNLIRPRGYKKCSCLTQLSTTFQLLMKTKIPTNEEVSCFKSLRCFIYHADNC